MNNQLNGEKGKASNPSDSIPMFLGKSYLNTKIKFARYLSEKEKKLTIRQKKIYLLVFCLFFSLLSLHTMVDAITVPVVKDDGNIYEHLNPTPRAKANENEQSTIKSDDIKRIRRHLDNLKNDSNKIDKYNEIVKERPGIIDGLNELEKHYQ